MLPSQAKLTHQQIMSELLPYHHIQQRSHNVCPSCLEDDRNATKVCFVCGNQFSDERGRSRRRGGDEAVDPVLASILAEQNRKHWKNATPEEKAASQKKFDELYAGKIITPEQEAKAIASLKKSQEKAKTESISLDEFLRRG